MRTGLLGETRGLNYLYKKLQTEGGTMFGAIHVMDMNSSLSATLVGMYVCCYLWLSLKRLTPGVCGSVLKHLFKYVH